MVLAEQVVFLRGGMQEICSAALTRGEGMSRLGEAVSHCSPGLKAGAPTTFLRCPTCYRRATTYLLLRKLRIWHWWPVIAMLKKHERHHTLHNVLVRV